jgi:hypothetical protein
MTTHVTSAQRQTLSTVIKSNADNNDLNKLLTQLTNSPNSINRMIDFIWYMAKLNQHGSLSSIGWSLLKDSSTPNSVMSSTIGRFLSAHCLLIRDMSFSAICDICNYKGFQ